ncbi:hypothetical protein IV83_GL002015 [Pediococcus inopinatus]|nr:hypothetical protein IV83_GL002015 [Pediococcus inopinatus]
MVSIKNFLLRILHIFIDYTLLTKKIEDFLVAVHKTKYIYCSQPKLKYLPAFDSTQKKPLIFQ